MMCTVRGNNPSRHGGNACDPSTYNSKASLGYIVKRSQKKNNRRRGGEEEKGKEEEEEEDGGGGSRGRRSRKKRRRKRMTLSHSIFLFHTLIPCVTQFINTGSAWWDVSTPRLVPVTFLAEFLCSIILPR